MKKVIAPIVLITVCAIAGLIYQQNKNKFRYAGTLETTKVVVSARVSSQINSMNVEEGAKVEVGEVIAELGCEDIKLSSKLATLNFDRTSELFKKNSISKAQYDTAETTKAELDLKVDWCFIKSPVSGTVLSKFKEVGEWVSPGVGVVSISDIKNIWSYFYLPHDEVVNVSLGQEIMGVLPELSDRSFTGKVVKINEEAEFTPKNVQTKKERTRLVYGVKVQFENEDETLKPGMTIEVLKF